MLHCIDARDGTRIWARKTGAVEWGVALWADINGDGRDEVVAGTREDGIVALDAAGRRLWAYRGEPGWPPLRINGPISAADVGLRRQSGGLRGDGARTDLRGGRRQSALVAPNG